MQAPSFEKQRFFAIITGHNIVYDNLGEKVSPEKITKAVANGQVKVSAYAEGQTEEDVIQAYRANPRSQLHAVATLVNFSELPSLESSNIHNLFVSNYRHFRVQMTEPVVSTTAPAALTK